MYLQPWLIVCDNFVKFARSKHKSAHQSDNAPIDAPGVPPIGSLIVCAGRAADRVTYR